MSGMWQPRDAARSLIPSSRSQVSHTLRSRTPVLHSSASSLPNIFSGSGTMARLLLSNNKNKATWIGGINKIFLR